METNVASESLSEFLNKKKSKVHESAKPIFIDVTKKNKKIDGDEEDEYAKLLKDLK
jgi:hypothetical protein